jgi:glycosyltransferase involved in cell wall biosynthesis
MPPALTNLDTPANNETSAVSPQNHVCELAIVMPCLNEAETLAVCIRKAQQFLHDYGITGEVIVADNGSTDGSQAIATSMGARLVQVAERGYGSALLGGIAAAQSTYIIMGDADDSYDFNSLAPFVEQLRGGSDLVMGNRFRGGIQPGAMPALHRHLGNPVLTGVGRLLFRSPAGDFHCGLRGFRKAAILQLDLRTTGMEFASEMVVKATLHGLRISEVPTTLAPDGRSRPPHLRSWRDGWRHLRFLLLYSPRWLFLYPGSLLMLLGLVIGLWLLPAPRIIGDVILDIHTLLYASVAIVIGFQAITFALFTKIFAINEGLLPDDPELQTVSRFLTLEAGLLVGTLLLVVGLGGSLYALSTWAQQSFGPLYPPQTFRVVIPSVTLLTLGCQTILNSFFLSILGLKRR